MTTMISPDALLTDAATLRAVMDTVIDGLITIDQRGTVCTFNPAAVKIFGYEPEEVIGRNVKMLMPEPYHSEHDGYLTNYERTGQAKIIGIGREVSARRKDGSVFPIDLGVSEMRVGETSMYVGIIRDITERKQQEANRIFLGVLLDNILDGLITIDEQGIILQVNRAAERMFGYKASELIGQRVNRLMGTRDAAVHDHYITHYKRGGDHKIIGVPGRELQARRKDGFLFPIELGVSEMRVHGKRVFAGLLRDISTRTAMEHEKQQFIADLARSNQELDDFAYIASHDLKEPLRGVANNALFLKEDYEGKLDEKGVKRLDRMVFLCKRMERLVDDLLYFSRLGRQALAIQPTDLNAVIKDIEVLMEATLHEQNAEIVIPKPLPTIVCDLPRITEVFRNLITNAVKYNKSARKRIEIGFLDNSENAHKGESPIFYVRDNGIGIPPDFHREIFRIFKRLNEEDDSVKGTGVGLTFVQKIIERHNGRIWLESEMGKGTTFYFIVNTQEAQRT
jgi:two-component system, LuxR family, sensor kinase FixL